MQDTLHLYLRADGAAKRWAPEQPWAELCPARHPGEPSGVQSVQVDRVWTCIKVVFNTSRFVWFWGRLGRRTRVCCCYASRVWFWAADTLPSPLLPSSVLTACVTHTDRWQ